MRFRNTSICSSFPLQYAQERKLLQMDAELTAKVLRQLLHNMAASQSVVVGVGRDLRRGQVFVGRERRVGALRDAPGALDDV